jgi:hypothetical protein
MGELITEPRERAERTLSRARQTEEDNDLEMKECLARLKVWRAENLMAPNGMARFAQDISTGKTHSSAARPNRCGE